MPDSWRRALGRRFGPAATDRALAVDGACYDYGTLGAVAHDMAGALRAGLGELSGHRIGIYARHSLTAYAALLAVLELDATYVPLDPNGPPDRTREIADRVGLTAVIADPRCLGQLGAALGDIPVYDPMGQVWAVPPVRAAPSEHRLGERDAYVLFTSGSTGTPKGIAIPDRCVAAAFDQLDQLAPIRPGDRVAQTFDLTFDLAQYSTLATWLSGAEVVVLSDGERLQPVEAIRRRLITYWFSVPSVARFSADQGALHPDTILTVRMSLFCGEALPAALARQWQRAAGGHPVLNLYGPTEATIACSSWPAGADDPATPNGLVPLGVPFAGTRFAVTPDGHRVQDLVPDVEGELLIGGLQVFDGYVGDRSQTAAAFLGLPGSGERWYRSGDRVRVDADGRLLFCGRVDEQVQVRGFRVEPREVEFRIAGALGLPADRVVVCPLLDPDGLVDRLAAAICSAEVTESQARAVLAAALPGYMVPSTVCLLPDVPLNANGKTDRAAVAAGLRQVRVA